MQFVCDEHGSLAIESVRADVVEIIKTVCTVVVTDDKTAVVPATRVVESERSLKVTSLFCAKCGGIVYSPIGDGGSR